MAELFGKRDGCCGGRGGTMHLYDRSVGLFGTNGIVGAGIGHAAGVGMSARLRRHATTSASPSSATARPTMAASTRRSTSPACSSAPAVFVCENNLYATATPLRHGDAQPGDRHARPRPTAFPASPSTATTCSPSGRRCARRSSGRARGDGPTLIEAKTYRTVGHHEGDPVIGTYRTQEEVDAWAKRDPIDMFRERLVEEYGDRRPATSSTPIDARDRRRSSRTRSSSPGSSPEPDPATVRCTSTPTRSTRPRRCAAPPPARRVDARAGSTRCATASPRRCGANPHILYFGEGTGERGGTFAHTKGLWQEFGAERMVDTPISEQGFTGAALGASATGARTIADLMFADFLFEAAGQIVLQAAKLRYMSNGQMNAPMVVRVGAGARAQRRARTTAAPIIRSGRMCRASSSACRRPRPTPRA